MKTISLYKAQSARDPVESVTIVVDETFPDLPTAYELAEGFAVQGRRLALNLIAVLPGGTLDELLVSLLKHRQSRLVVPAPSVDRDPSSAAEVA
jgi:hypothetical protein